jgi:hypothetical protein
VSGEAEHPAPGGVFHLISAHEVVPTNWHFHPTYTAMCGALVETSSLPGTDCPSECECEFSATMAHCSACLREAIRLNHRAGVDAGDVVTARG